MKPIYLKPDQSLLFVAPKDPKINGWGDKMYIENPPYRPGEKCYVREAWCLYQTLNMRRTPDGRSFDEISDGMYGYKADGFDTIQDFKDHVRLMSDSSFLDIFVKDDRWQSPAVMPMKAARYFRRIVSCEPMRVSEVTEEDAKRTGLFGSAITRDCKLPKFKKWWQSKHPDKQWAWRVEVRPLPDERR